nr:XtrA/YqaO family protein [Indiicoccus explosivorum]
MRLMELKINETNVIELDIMELPDSCVVVINDGKVKLAELPPHAETKIITHKGRVTRVKWDEGEEF